MPTESLRNCFPRTWRRRLVLLPGALLGLAVHAGERPAAGVQALTRSLWPRERIVQAIQEVEAQKTAGLLTGQAYERRMAMLQHRLEGTYAPQSLSATNPPLNFIQNAGFEQTNPNSERNRSRWLWWGGWSWGGDYENMWEESPDYVHSGKFSARIRCTGTTGRIGINAPPLPVVPGADEYTLSFWAKGEGTNQLFVNFEEGAAGVLRQRIGADWLQYTVTGKPVEGKKTFTVYFYSVGGGTIWLDDVSLVPVGGKIDE